MSSPSASLFETLSTRPPTPPRDISKAVDDAITFLDDSNEIERSLQQTRSSVQLSADLATRSASPQQAVATGISASKRVGFSPHLKYHKIAATSQQSSPTALLHKSVPSSKDVKPLRSILKQSDVPPPLTPDDLETKLSYFSPKDPGSFAKMLQSVIQQLAGPSVTSRLDAYLALNGALKAYDGVPDRLAMMAKMDLFMQFMTRDMVWKNANGALDVNIVTQALKLAGAILYDPKLSGALDDDFRTFLIDRSIAVLEHAETPKAITKTHMYLLAQPRFYSSAMTASQADKLVSLLHNIEDHCSGNGIIATRLVIYQRLIEKATAMMANRARGWLEHVFHGMLSSIKDVRIRAIETCTLAGALLGTQSHVGKALNEMLDTEVEEGQSYCDFFSLRLMQMISDADTGPDVPQIWSAIIMFFRNKWRPLEKWSKMKAWLLIIQKCLNASDLNTKYQAHLAWDKLVLGVMPDSSTLKVMFSMLKVPITAGLDKRGNDKFTKQSRQFAWNSYYNLLHYALRPSLTHDELDAAWDMYVDSVLSDMITRSAKDRYTACRVLYGLFNQTNGFWNTNAANETTPIKPHELSRLDPRWVRSRLSRPLRLLEAMLQSSMWLSAESNASLDAALYSLVQIVAEAGSQEVKTSNELKEAIALIVSMLRRIWMSAAEPPEDAEQDAWIQRYGKLVKIIVQGIGSTPFAEDILAKTKDDELEAATTPSHRASKHHSALQSPLVYLFGLLYLPPSNMRPTGASYSALAEVLLNLLMSCKASTLSKLDLLSRSLQVWSLSITTETNELLASRLWCSVASCAKRIMERDDPKAESHGSQYLGHGMRNATNILLSGIEFASTNPEEAEMMVLELYQAISSAAFTATGSGGQILAVIEPIARYLVDRAVATDHRVKLTLASRMLGTKCWPRSRQELDVARKALWGIDLAPHKTAVFNPYEHLYGLVQDLMTSGYDRMDSTHTGDLGPASDFTTSCTAFVKACPRSLFATVLRRMQDGLVVWIEDKSRRTSGSDSIAATVQASVQEILRLLRALPQHDTDLLKTLDPLMVACFSSPHKPIVSATITFWNDTFGRQSTLEYSGRLEGVLRARLADTDLALPDFPDNDGDYETVVLPPFYESQARLPNTNPSDGSTEVDRHEESRVPATATPVQGTRLGFAKPFVPRLAGVSSPVSSASKRRNRSTSKARLRHDDSQIQFAPIDSSPIRFDGESQHLTDHQKDIKEKQLVNAQMFPDLSSSPVAQQLALPHSVQKRLDFTTVDSADAETRADLADPDVLMSDDMPSSPTPSSTRDRDAVQLDMDDDKVNEKDMPDPPSSPPRRSDDTDLDAQQVMVPAHEVAPDATTIVDTDFEADPYGSHEDIDDEDLPTSAGSGNGMNQVDVPSDLRLDTLLPTAQLQEEEMVAAEAQRQSERHAVEDDSQEPPNEDEVTSIENSFIEPAPMSQGDNGSNENSQQSQRGNRKRKRSSTNHAAKRRKQQSPFKRFMSSFSFLGRSQEEDDDDIGDEIVVASSQVSSSPVKDVPIEVAEEQSALPTEEKKLPVELPRKRSRGRPRKSATPTPASAGSNHQVTKTLKRRASALSNLDNEDTDVDPVSTKDIQAPTKARKQREGKDAKLINEAQSSQEFTEISRRKKRAVTAVAIPGDGRQHDAPPHGDIHAGLDDNEQDGVTPDQQLAGEAAAAVVEQSSATSKGILSQLRGMLSVLPRMVLGAQEEREVDDLLFEIRKEVHEAGSRGRA